MLKIKITLTGRRARAIQWYAVAAALAAAAHYLTAQGF